MAKTKLLVLSDNPLAISGVATQTRFLLEGLLKTGKYTIRSLGGAMKHQDYRPILVDKEKYGEDFVIFPVDGFGNENILRSIVDQEKPDCSMLITDPRFFEWYFRMWDETNPRFPTVYWHLWDNYPVPKFNKIYYDSCEYIGCINEQTVDFIEKCGTKTPYSYIPHAIPDEIYHPLDEKTNKENRTKFFGPNANKTIIMYVGRNARRKRTTDIMIAVSEVLKKYPNEFFLYMHCNPHDHEGSNLIEVAGQFNLLGNRDIGFTTMMPPFSVMKELYNSVDFVINASSAEGFGLPIQETMLCGTRVLSARTGGLKDQIIHEDLGDYFNIDVQTLNGTQQIPYIFDDYCSIETMVKVIEKNHLMLKDIGREKMREKVIAQIPLLKQKFNYNNLITSWDNVIQDSIKRHKEIDRKIIPIEL